MNPYPNLRVLRLQHNFKQEYVADTLGMSQPEYSKLESGSRKLDAPCIRDLCNLYDVSSDILLQSNSAAADSTGNAYAYGDKNNHQKSIKTITDQVPHDVLMKMMENYSFLLESYLKQQQVQEKIIDKLINKDSEKEKDN